MNILLSGGMGYIRSHTAATLIEAGHELTLFNNLSNSDSSVLQSLEKINHKKIPYDIVARRDDDTAISYIKPDLANVTLHWKTKRMLESMCESACKFNEGRAI
jgi:UDP-glucose 4-epimerase